MTPQESMPTAMNDRGKLDAAYRATRYCVELPDGGRALLRIGEPSAEFAAALEISGATCWAIVTAANPASLALSNEENARRHQALRDMCSRSGRSAWPGTNEADGGDWPPEPTLCILDIDLPEALRWASGFQQNAIVAGGADGVPMLVWLSAKKPEA